MLLFHLRIEGDPCNKYYARDSEYMAMRNDTLFNIIGKDFEYDDNGKHIIISVIRFNPNSERKKLPESCGFCGYDWAVESLIKFGYIISVEDQRKQRAKRLASL